MSPNTGNLLPSLTRDDSIVLLLGQTGAGKSTVSKPHIPLPHEISDTSITPKFVNHLVGQSVMTVGHNIKSQTEQVSHYTVPNPRNRRRRIMLVDTPGFDDYKIEDRDILDKIVHWLKKSGDNKLKILIVYLVEIDQVRRINAGGMSPTRLVSAGLNVNLVVASTKWSCLKNEEIGARREPALEQICSCAVYRFKDSTQSAWDIIDIGAKSPVIAVAELASQLDTTLPKKRPKPKRGFLRAIFANLFSKEIIKTAFDAGINMFDTAEAYAGGESEIEMGRVIKELGLRRTDLVVTTKLFWGLRTGPNDGGLSRKHIIEGTKESLERLGLEYVDVLFAHRPDNTVPMEEIVRAFNYVIDKGWVGIPIFLFSHPITIPEQAFYWATSEWSALEIEEAHRIMFHRERPEKEYDPLYRKYGLGTTTFSSLAAGLLTGKYNDGIPEGSRFATVDMFKKAVPSLQQEEGQEKIRKVRELTKLAAEGGYFVSVLQYIVYKVFHCYKELQTTPAALALAWVAKNPNTSTVILGASSAEQLKENLKALEVLPRLTSDIMEKIEVILNNKPAPPVNYGRPPLDILGRP
ncbi:hypothetical protein H0H87_009448 [Tephrocybe sp. NHM501043]|nr:hypothetical protein H0H87_009448 [Tephrocybe sp. NHM501043]